MDINLVRIFGQVAGLAGLSLGMVLLLFREVIRKNVFSALTREHSFQLLRLVLMLAWSLAIVGIGAWAYARTVQEPPASSLTRIGRPIITHSGDHDPLKEGFVNSEDIKEAGGKIVLARWPDPHDPPAWRIRNPVRGAVPYFKKLSAEDAAEAEKKGWRITLVARLIEVIGSDGGLDAVIHANFDTGDLRYDLNVVPAYPQHKEYTDLIVRLNTFVQKSGSLVGGEESPTAKPIPGGRSHKYVMTYDPATRSARVDVDDAPLLKALPYAGHNDYTSGFPSFVFGASDADATFESVKFEIFE
jgi:hypothetical protein